MKTPIRSFRTTLSAALLSAGAGLLWACPALAQSAPAGSFDRPLGASAPTARSADDTTLVITSSENGKTYSVKMHNDQVSAEVDGQPVPPDRLDRKGDVIIIKDKDGKTIKTFDVGVRSSASGRATVRLAQPLSGTTWVTPQGPGGAGGTWMNQEPANPPPVMVGITMSDLDEALAQHLGLKDGEAFVIDRVVDDLPAAKAGLEAADVVVAIEGQKPASQDKFRELLRAKKPGDSLELTILRKGKEKKITLELAAYDRSKLATAGPNQMLYTPSQGTGDDHDENAWMRALGGGPDVNAEITKQLEEALDAVRQSDKTKPEEARKQAEKALTKAIESLSKSNARSAERLRLLSDAMGNHEAIVLGDQPGQVFAMPGDRDMSRRLERLSGQLEKLNRRLEEIEKRLSEKK